MTEWLFKGIWFLAGALVAFGAKMAKDRQMRKDLNGIGKRQKKFEENATKAILVACPAADRIAIASILKGSE